MTKPIEMQRETVDLIPISRPAEVTILPPNSGYVGEFLGDVRNMLKARAMRMTGLMRRINESGQRTEALLRMAAQKMEAEEAALEEQFQNQGLFLEDSAADDCPE
jgi:hypothetical protein